MATPNGFPTTLLAATRYFGNPDVALAAAVALRWKGGPVTCPTCGNTDVHFIATRRIWRCASQHPQRQFSVKVGTIMEDSPIPLDKWMVAIWLLSNCRNGISSYEIARDLGVTQKTGWFLMHRIRLAMQTGHFDRKLAGTVEIDETYIGGKARNMHAAKRKRLGINQSRSMIGKVAVMGLLERHGDGGSQVRIAQVRGVKKRDLLPHIEANVERGATVNTDSLPTYCILDSDFVHNVIDHAEQYVDGQIHTNGLENFWSLLKRAIKGTYVAVEPFHLHRYLDEQCFRFNNRKLTDAERFAHAASAIVGKRVTYKMLTGHELPESSQN